MPGKTKEGERRETIVELSELLIMAQGMGQRLANETHGDSYAKVREFNDLLHQACIQLDRIKDGTIEGD